MSWASQTDHTDSPVKCDPTLPCHWETDLLQIKVSFIILSLCARWKEQRKPLKAKKAPAGGCSTVHSHQCQSVKKRKWKYDNPVIRRLDTTRRDLLALWADPLFDKDNGCALQKFSGTGLFWQQNFELRCSMVCLRARAITEGAVWKRG